MTEHKNQQITAPQQRRSTMIAPVIAIAIFVALVALFSGSIINILNSIIASSDTFFTIAMVLIVLSAISWFVYQSKFNPLQKEPMKFEECLPAVVDYFKDIYEVNFVPMPFNWEGARLDPTLGTYVIVMHFNFLEVVSPGHPLFFPDLVLRWDAVRNCPTKHTDPLKMDINKDINEFPLEQGKLTQEGYEKARIRQIVNDE